MRGVCAQFNSDGVMKAYGMDTIGNWKKEFLKEECYDKGYWRKFNELCKPNEPGC